MGKKERTKGAAYEREVAAILRDFFPSVARNLAQYQSNDGRDFDGTEPLCLQAKRRKRVRLCEIVNGWIEANESTSPDYPYPCVVYRDDGSDSWITMKLDHFVEFLCMMEDGLL